MSLDIKVMPLGPISANCYILTDKKSRESAVIGAILTKHLKTP